MRRLILKVGQQKQEACDALEISQRALHDNEELVKALKAHREAQEKELEDTIDLFISVLLENKSYYIRVAKAKLKELRENLL